MNKKPTLKDKSGQIFIQQLRKTQREALNLSCRLDGSGKVYLEASGAFLALRARLAGLPALGFTTEETSTLAFTAAFLATGFLATAFFAVTFLATVFFAEAFLLLRF